MRILLVTFGSLGDLHPMLALGRELQRRGHEAVIATSEYFRGRVTGFGLPFAAVRPDFRLDDETLVRRIMAGRRGTEFLLRDLVYPSVRVMHADLAPLVGPSVGIFLGGSTEWKLARMADWGAFCREHGCHFHVARVNTIRRIRMAHAAMAHSIDGTSATRFATTLPALDLAARQPDLIGRAA